MDPGTPIPKPTNGVAALPAAPEANHEENSTFVTSFAQQRLWFLEQFEPGKPIYNITKAVRLRGVLDASVLEKALNETIQRHEPLRTIFGMVDAQPVQIITPWRPFELPVVDLAGWPESRRDEELLRLGRIEAQRPFDSAKDLMLRAELVRLGSEESILFLTLHHIAADGWSVGVLFRELAALYEAFVQEKPSPLPELSVQYADFAVWQRQWLQGQVLDGQLAYWKKQLAGAPALLELPTDRTRPASQTFQGATQTVVLPKVLLQALKELSQREGVTLFMTLLAAFKAFLHRYTGQEDIVIGSPIAGRNRIETEGMIGLFANTLVIRSDLSGDPTFRELLGRIRTTALGAYAHQELPFEKLVEELQPERNLSYNPLFQVLFAFQNAPVNSLHAGGLSLTLESVPGETAQFDFSLYLNEREDGLEAGWEFNTDLFEPATVTRMRAHFQNLLAGIVANPTLRLSQFPLLSPAEGRQLIEEWNDTKAQYPRECCVHELFVAQAQRTPDRIAVEFGSQRCTYRELHSRSDRIAAHLRSLGVGPDDLVGICVERSLDMIAAVLGILKAGGAYVPLDPAYPKDRLFFVLADAGARVLLTHRNLQAGLAGSGPPSADRGTPVVLCLDALPELRGGETGSRPVSSSTCPENLAYVIYTSGSTGKPKGVRIPHRAVVNFLTSMRREPGLIEEDVLLAVTTLSFDIAGLELFLPLTTGARVVLASREAAADGHQLVRLLERCEATVMQATPATWRLLLEAGWKGGPQFKVLCGGEAWNQDLAGQLLQRCGSLWNLYGPTETTIWSAASPVRAGNPVVIGKPIANTQFYVLDRRLQPVPIGVPGELCIGGEGVARGYLNRPELTEEKFLPDPFRPEPGARIYRTGDLVRFRPGGLIEFLGRIDHQVKVRGYRIELGEIEAALGRCPSVRQAVVIVREDVPGDQRLVAYLVAGPSQTPAAGDLRNLLKESLPDYMVPSAFVFLPAFPQTPNGKVDRRALPAPMQPAAHAEASDSAPADVLEYQLQQIWEQVLGLGRVGVRDNFFEIGGHSMLAIRLFAQIERLTGKHLPLATLFQAPTIARLAAILRDDGWVPPWTSLVPIHPKGSKIPFFCVHAAGGNVLFYRDLAKRLGDDQPFYGLQAQGLDRKHPRHTTAEEMAAHYVEEIRSLQPEGPYLLGGSSFGGQIAFEMARQLCDAGQTVGLVALFDTHGPGYPNYRPGVTAFHRKFFNLVQRVDHHLVSLFMLEWRGKLVYFLQKAKKAKVQVKRGGRKSFRRLASQIYLGLGRAVPQHLREAENAITDAVNRYVTPVYHGRVVLFRAKKQPYGVVPDPTLGWGQVVRSKLEICEVPGHHGSVVAEPYVRFLAEKLKRQLQEAQEECETGRDEGELASASAS